MYFVKKKFKTIFDPIILVILARSTTSVILLLRTYFSIFVNIQR